MTFQEEQDSFQKYIEENYISLFDLIQKLVKEKELSVNNASLYLLTRINSYIEKENYKHFAFVLKEPPFEKYSLIPLPMFALQNMLNFAVSNGQFRPEKQAKKAGIRLSVLNIILAIKYQEHEELEQNKENKPYNQTERNTHLQMIAILAEELAKAKGSKYLKSNNLPNNLQISELLAALAKEIEIEALTAKSVDTYRKRLNEISQFYKGI